MTIKDVAAYCGVSVSTVSRALNGHPDVSEDMRNKVLEAARALRYVPNRSARDLAMNQSDTIGLVVRGGTNPFFTPIEHAIEHEAELRGYGIVPRQLSSAGDEIGEAAELARTKRLKGVVLLGGRFDYSTEDAQSIGVPFVCCSYTNHFGDLPKDAYSSVSINDKAEAYKAARALIDAGHTRIACLLSATDDQSISQLRYQGYRKALESHGIPVDEELVMCAGSFDIRDAYEAVREKLRQGAEFTALFAIADSMAIGAMRALRDAGRRIPEDCSVIAIDGLERSAYIEPPLTTLCQPMEEMGRRSAQILLGMLRGHGAHCCEVLPTQLREGGSVQNL